MAEAAEVVRRGAADVHLHDPRMKGQDGETAPEACVDGAARDNAAFPGWNLFGRRLLEVAHVAGPDVEMDDRGLLVQINNRCPWPPSHGTRLRGRGSRDALKGVPKYS